MQHLLIILAVLCATSFLTADRKLYFAAPSKPGQHVPVGSDPLTFEAGARINLQLEARTRSVEDQNRFVSLIVDDYRYDEPKYFTDKRVPNVTFDVSKDGGNGRYQRVPFRVSSQGGGASLEYLQVHVSFEIGGDPEKVEAETNRVYQEITTKFLRPEEAQSRIEAIRRQFAPNQPGRYRIRAFYRPRVPGKWRERLSRLQLQS